MITLNEVKNNPHILEFTRKTDESLKSLGYTEHGMPHAELVSARARTIAREIGFSKEIQEMCAIAGFCHDMGNFLSRSSHHLLGAMLFYQTLKESFVPGELSAISQAIAYHDKTEMNFSDPVAAVLVLADKSDVRKSRVRVKDLDKIKMDIHDRVNFFTTDSKLKINKKKKLITLILKIDTNSVPVMEYFEIFMERMSYCRQAAKFLGYKFGLVINNFKLL
jgi:hypothetical protein